MLMMMNSTWDRDVNKMKNCCLRCSYRLADKQWQMIIFLTLLLESVILILYCELGNCIHLSFFLYYQDLLGSQPQCTSGPRMIGVLWPDYTSRTRKCHWTQKCDILTNTFPLTSLLEELMQLTQQTNKCNTIFQKVYPQSHPKTSLLYCLYVNVCLFVCLVSYPTVVVAFQFWLFVCCFLSVVWHRPYYSLGHS